MKKLVVGILFLALLLAGMLKWYRTRLNASIDEKAFIEERDTGLEQDAPDEAMRYQYERTKNPKLGRPTPEVLPFIKKTAKRGSDFPGSLQSPWVERGPDNFAGRTRAILIDRNDPSNNTVWAGGVGGGLWKTTNFLSDPPDWLPINDFFKNIAITSIAQDPNNLKIIYFSTGEGFFNSDAIRGLGIWKTENGGLSWSQLVSTENDQFAHIQKIVVDPNSRVWAATKEGGLQYSSNGGRTWQQLVLGADGYFDKRITDIEIASDGYVYVSNGMSFPNYYFGDVYRFKINDFNSVQEITPGPKVFGRIEIAVSPSRPQRIYLLCEGENNDVEYIFSSDNHGSTWESRIVPTIIDHARYPVFTRHQAHYDLIAKVHPENPDEIYIGGIDALGSFDGGYEWTQISAWSLGSSEKQYGLTDLQYIHADHHVIEFLPGNTTQAIWGTDGGLFFSKNLDTYRPTFLIKNKGYNVTQYYSCAIHPEAGLDYYLGGTQDNRTIRIQYKNNMSGSEVSSGDGGFCFIDVDQPNIQISSAPYNVYNLSTDNWRSKGTIINDRESGSFINPSAYDSKNNILFTYRTPGSIFRFSNIGLGSIAKDSVVYDFGDKITYLGVYPTQGENTVLYVGSYLGQVFRIDRADTDNYSVVNIAIQELLAGGTISSIAFGLSDQDLLATISNYGVKSLWLSHDGGKNWRSVEGDLPDMPVYWAIFNPYNYQEVIIATEVGVWYCADIDASNPSWITSNNGLANTRVEMLQMRASDGQILAATHGRGLFTNAGFKAEALPCPNISSVEATDITSFSAKIRWSASSSHTSYLFRFRETGTSSWYTFPLDTTGIDLGDLIPCQEYEYQILSKCDGSESGYSASLKFITTGCGGFRIDPQILTLSANAGFGFFNVYANVNWKVINKPSWVTLVNPSAGNDDQQITFSYQGNGSSQREGLITFMTDEGNYTLRVIQRAPAIPGLEIVVLPAVYANAGMAVTYRGDWINYTIGEVFISNLIGDGIRLTEGFQQPGPNIRTSSVGSELNPTVIQVYPNPSSDFLHLTSTVEFNQITIYDMHGRSVYTKKLATSNLDETISTTDWHPGIYLVECMLKDHLVQGVKILIF